MFKEQNPTNICYGNPCIVIKKGCQTPDFLSCPELNVAVLNVFSLFRNYLPLENGVTLQLYNIEFLDQRKLCAKFDKIVPVILEKKIFKDFVK